MDAPKRTDKTDRDEPYGTTRYTFRLGFFKTTPGPNKIPQVRKLALHA